MESEEFLAEFFLELIADGKKYLANCENADLEREVVRRLCESFSLVANLPKHVEVPYTYAYVQLVAHPEKGLISLLKAKGENHPAFPDDLVAWRKHTLRRLTNTYLRWRSLSANRILAYFIAVVPGTECGIVGWLGATRNKFPARQQICGENVHRDTIKALKDAKQIVKCYFVLVLKIEESLVEDAQSQIEIEWDQSFLQQFRKPITGRSFSFLFAALFFVGTLQELAKLGHVFIADTKTGEEVAFAKITLPQKVIMSGAFDDSQIKYHLDSEGSYAADKTVEVAGISHKISLIREVNQAFQTAEKAPFFERILLPQGNMSEISQVDDLQITAIKDFADLVRNLFPKWNISPTGERARFPIDCQMSQIRMSTFDPIPDPTPYDLDWSDCFAQRKIKDDALWAKKFLPELRDLKSELRKVGNPPNLEVIPQAILSVGFAIGYVFSQPSGYALLIRQNNFKTSEQEIWSTKENPVLFPLEIDHSTIDPSTQQLVVTISITRNVRGAAREYLEREKLFAPLLSFSVADGASRETVARPGEAISIAKQIGDTLTRFYDEYRFQKMHMFYSGPFALSAFIGHYLNACGQIQVYEYSDNEYSPSFLLKH